MPSAPPEYRRWWEAIPCRHCRGAKCCHVSSSLCEMHKLLHAYVTTLFRTSCRALVNVVIKCHTAHILMLPRYPPVTTSSGAFCGVNTICSTFVLTKGKVQCVRSNVRNTQVAGSTPRRSRICLKPGTRGSSHRWIRGSIICAVWHLMTTFTTLRTRFVWSCSVRCISLWQSADMSVWSHIPFHFISNH